MNSVYNPLLEKNETCFICLEGPKLLRPLIHSTTRKQCACKFLYHKRCWETWMLGRKEDACPYCKRDAAESVTLPPSPVSRNPFLLILFLLFVSLILFIFLIIQIVKET